jgi:hypothetical protein
MDQDKKRHWLRVPSPSMIVACVALFVALGGTSYAAIKLPANSVGTKQIKKSAVTTAKIKDATVTAADLAAGAVGTAKIGAIPGARVRDTATTTIQTGATAVLPFNATDFNVGGVYDSTKPSRMTAPIAGRYLVTASARWTANAAGRRTIALEVNGTAAQIARTNVSAFSSTGTLAPEQTAQTVYKLNAGDYVEVWAYQDSGGPLDLLTAVDNGVTFSMEWIAP